MLDALLIVLFLIVSYFSIKRNTKDRQTVLLDRLEKYLDKVAPIEEEGDESGSDEEENDEEEEGSEKEDSEKEEPEEEEDPLVSFSKLLLGQDFKNPQAMEELINKSKELLKEQVSGVMSQENRQETEKMISQIMEFIKL